MCLMVSLFEGWCYVFLVGGIELEFGDEDDVYV